MANTSLSKEMILNFDMLNTDEQQSILQLIKTFLKNKKNNSSSQTIEEYNLELKNALRAVKSGGGTSFEQLEKEMKLW